MIPSRLLLLPGMILTCLVLSRYSISRSIGLWDEHGSQVTRKTETGATCPHRTAVARQAWEDRQGLAAHFRSTWDDKAIYMIPCSRRYKFAYVQVFVILVLARSMHMQVVQASILGQETNFRGDTVMGTCSHTAKAHCFQLQKVSNHLLRVLKGPAGARMHLFSEFWPLLLGAVRTC